MSSDRPDPDPEPFPRGPLARGGAVARPTDAALWRSVVTTLRSLTEAPATSTTSTDGDDAAVRTQLERLRALAGYATTRGPDPTPARRAHLRRLLGADAGADDAEVDSVLTSVLVDEGDPRRPALRAALVEHLDEDLASERVLLEGFPAPGNPSPAS